MLKQAVPGTGPAVVIIRGLSSNGGKPERVHQTWPTMPKMPHDYATETAGQCSWAAHGRAGADYGAGNLFNADLFRVRLPKPPGGLGLGRFVA